MVLPMPIKAAVPILIPHFKMFFTNTLTLETNAIRSFTHSFCANNNGIRGAIPLKFKATFS